MKITLVNPPSPFLLSDKVFPPLGILYVASTIRRELPGVDIEVADFSGGATPEIDGDIVCVTGTTPHYGFMKSIAREYADRFLIAGGGHATADPQSLVDVGYDAVVRGEGEPVIADVIKGRRTGIVTSRPVSDLDTVPFPDRSLIDIHSYGYDLNGTLATVMMLSRGCPFSCAFCSVHSRRYRLRSVGNAMKELHILLRDGWKSIMFFDDLFGLDRKWSDEFLDAISKENIKWRCFMRATLVDDYIMERMAEAGCAEIGVGVESGSNRILRAINKRTTVEDNTRARQIAKKYGIRFKAFLIVGLPGETEETALATRDWVIENRPDAWSLALFAPIPGSPIWEHPERYDYQILSKDYDNMWWEGIMKNQVALGRTSALSPDEILALRERIRDDIVRAGLRDRNDQYDEKGGLYAS